MEKDIEIRESTVVYNGKTYGWNSKRNPSVWTDNGWKPVIARVYPPMPERFDKIVLCDIAGLEEQK